MINIAHLLNRVVTTLFDLVCLPFQTTSPIWAITVISLISGVVMVWIFGKVSNQTTIKQLREKIRGNLIGVRLFQSDIGVVLKLQKNIFGDTARYMKCALIPMLVLIIPVLLIMAQLNLRFALAPVEPGKTALIKVVLKNNELLRQNVSLQTSDDILVETSGMRIPSKREITWRVRPLSSGQHQMTVRVNEEILVASFIAGGQWGKTPQRLTGKSAIDLLLYPGTNPIPSQNPIESVEITYPLLDLRAFGWNVHWLVAFFVLSMVFGFTFKEVLGVEI